MKGIRILNRAERNSAEILIYEDIGEGFFTSGVTAQGFLHELRALGDVKNLDIRINSNGGSVFDGVAIYNALRQHPATKTVHVDGIAASIASIIAMAGDDIRMGEGAWMMIHDPSGLAMGTAEDMRQTADLLDGIKLQLVDIYASRTGIDSDTVQAMMRAETWLTAEDAIAQGFATSYGAPINIAAHADASRFRNIPAVLNHSSSGPSDVPNTPAAPAVTPPQPSERKPTMNLMDQLKARAADHQAAAAAVRQKAIDEKRDLSAAERSLIQNELDNFEAVQADIALQARLENADDFLNQSAGRKVQPDGLKNTVIQSATEKGKAGFNHFGEFCAAVKNHVTVGKTDPRLIANAATTYGQESVGADGGFAVPPEWRSQIMTAVMGEDSLLGRCDVQQTSGNSITFPTDETTAWQTSGGILTYWDGEAAAMTASKPNLKEVTVKLHKITSLVPVTDELLEDAPAMGGYVAGKAAEKIAFAVNNALINGTGAGQPLGIMNAPCLVTVAKEGSQTAATVHADNVVKMMARMPAQSYANSVWLINQDVIPQILKLGFAVTTASGTAAGAGALYLPPNGLSQTPYGSLLGRPIVVTEACQTLGTVGDIVLADMSKYLAVTKSAGIRSDSSIHLYFDQNVTAFRFVMRVAGQPWLNSPIARKNGSNTLSHFVALATRT